MAPEGLLQLSGATFIEYYAIFSEVKRIIVFFIISAGTSA